MKITLLLCDRAEAVQGKLYVLGGGWSILSGPGPYEMALAIKLEVPWDEANKRHRLVLSLTDADGRAVQAPTPMGAQPISIPADLEVGRPPGLRPGTPLDVVHALNVAGLPLPPGRYVWRLEFDGKTDEHWQAGFEVRVPPEASPAQAPTDF